jgi:hypothetical protein
VVKQRDPGEPLAAAWHAVKLCLDHRADAVDFDAAVRRRERRGVEDRDGPDVHVRITLLELEEARIQC